MAMTLDADRVIAGVGVLLAVMPHVAALVGTPLWLAKIGAVKAIYDLLAGNYRKAKNRPE
jgi:hypothetical protein